MHSWSLGIQRQISANSALELRYVGNHADSLFQSINQNPLVSGFESTFPSVVPSNVTPCATPAAAAAAGRENCNLGVSIQIGNYGYSDYQAFQAQFRTTALEHQLTLITAYTYSKTTDNASAAFQSTFAGGSSLAFAQNPFNYEGGEHGISGLDFPNSWTVSFNEAIPAFRHQHGIVGHVLGGWNVAGTYALTSGQTYTPIQYYLQATSYFAQGEAPPDDYVFNSSVVGVYDFARPFWGSKSAPVNQVGVYAGDECGEQEAFGAPSTIPVCTATPTQLISLNQFDSSGGATITPVAKNQVHFIGNGFFSDAAFGTPFGNVARNVSRDYWTNGGNFSLYKNIKFTERNWLQFHMTMLNVFNHPDFASVDPAIEDAGYQEEGVGFGTPNLTGGGSRTIYFGLKIVY